MQYEKPANAQSAIEKENGSMFLGKRIDVNPAKRGAPHNKDAEESSAPRSREDRDNRDEYSQQGSHICISFHF